MTKQSKIYIAGASGFVGSHLLRELKNRGYKNLIVDCANLKRASEVNEIFKAYRPEYVFICAAKVGGIAANMFEPFTFYQDNIQIQSNILNHCISYQVKKVMFLGSSCVYPKDYKQPLKEEYLMCGPLEPTNEAYAMAKIAGLKFCEYANITFETEFISLMPSNLFGPGEKIDPEKSHVLAAIIQKVLEAKKGNFKIIKLWGTGKPRREFMYIDDMIDGMIWAINELDYIHHINIGTGKDHTIEELAHMVMEAAEYECEIIYNNSMPDGMMKKCLDVSKINKLGWKAKTSLKDGIKKTVEYYDKPSK